MRVDHVVLWVSDQQQALDFFVRVVGLKPVRAEEFASGSASFPSVRIGDASIIDLMDKANAALVLPFTGGQASGSSLNHLCLSMSKEAYLALEGRLEANGYEVRGAGAGGFGAQGAAEQSAYFGDPDGNIIEMRYYPS